MVKRIHTADFSLPLGLVHFTQQSVLTPQRGPMVWSQRSDYLKASMVL